MNITEVRKKVKTLQSLLREWDQIYCTINAIHRFKENQQTNLDDDVVDKDVIDRDILLERNMKRRLKTIEDHFDNILK